MSAHWNAAALSFLRSLQDPETSGTRSVPGGSVTLYGTCYAALGQFYLGVDGIRSKKTRAFIGECQDPQTGLMIGPELINFEPPTGVMHGREHMLVHLTCAAVLTCQQFDIPLKHPIRAAHRFCDLEYLREWLVRHNRTNAWFEVND